MFLLGHIGIGTRMARPLSAKSAWPWLVAGCVLPDLLDKPLYYALCAATGRHAAELGLISSTRTIGHSLVFALACALLLRAVPLPARARDALPARRPDSSGDAQVRSQRALALLLGMVSHLLLDLGSDVWNRTADLLARVPPAPPIGPPTAAAVFFPLLGPHFPIAPFHSFAEHAASQLSGYVVFGELAGAALLLADWRAHRQRLAHARLEAGRAARAVVSPDHAETR